TPLASASLSGRHSLRPTPILRRRARAGHQVPGRTHAGRGLGDFHQRADALARAERTRDRGVLADHLEAIDAARVDLAEDGLLDPAGGGVARVAILPL